MISIYKPFANTDTRKFAFDAIRSNWISSKGIYLKITEKKLKEMFGYKHIVLANNGTTAMHLVAKALQYKYPDIKNIICPNNVYIAAWNAFLYDNRYKLFPIDANIDTWQLDENELDEFLQHKQISQYALLAVHNISGIINIPKIKRKYPDLIIVEDNCEGFTGMHEEEYTGTQSLCSAVSYFGNKSITSGEGGAFITSDREIYDYINCIHNQGNSSKKYISSELGYNYRMTNICASLLYGSLFCYKEIKRRKLNLFDYYYKELSKYNSKIKLQEIDANCTTSGWMFAVRIVGNKSYNDIEKYFTDKDIEVRPLFYPITYHNHLKQYIPTETKIDTAELLSREAFMIPSYPDISDRDREKVIKTIKDYIGV